MAQQGRERKAGEQDAENRENASAAVPGSVVPGSVRPASGAQAHGGASGTAFRSRVEAVMRQLETALLDGTWQAGDRLPAERDLAAALGISRNTLREATQRLAARGLLQPRRGAGVYVTDRLRTGIASPWRQLVADHPALRADILEFRSVLEAATAYFAAQRADGADRKRIRAQLRRLEAARAGDDKLAEAEADARLHDAIAQASHNTMLLHLQTSVVGLLREHITVAGTGLRERHPDASGHLLAQHRALCDAILARRPEAARAAMLAHIDFVRESVRDAPETGQLMDGERAAGDAPVGPTRSTATQKRVRPTPLRGQRRV